MITHSEGGLLGAARPGAALLGLQARPRARDGVPPCAPPAAPARSAAAPPPPPAPSLQGNNIFSRLASSKTKCSYLVSQSLA